MIISVYILIIDFLIIENFLFKFFFQNDDEMLIKFHEILTVSF